MKIIWTLDAESSLIEISDDIQNKFSDKEVEKFLVEVQQVLHSIKEFPKAYPKTNFKRIKGCHKVVVHPHTSIFYKIEGSKIILLLFWDNRNNPKEIK